MTEERRHRYMRWWMPASLVILASLTAVFLWWFEIPFLEPVLIGVALLTCLLIGLWYLFFTGLPWKRRWLLFFAGAALVGAICGGLALLTRVEGSIGGSGIPRLVWEWSPRKEGTGRPLPFQAGSAPTSSRKRTSELAGGSFPQFLGPDRTGMVTATPLRHDWRQSPPKPIWRQPIGLGWSAFAVSGRRAITQEQRGDAELIVCYELHSGRAVWAHTNQVRFSEMLGGDGPRATPTIHEGRVYSMGASGILDCLEESTGRTVWSRDVLGENSLSNVSWGKSCSPLMAGNLVVVTGGNEREKTLLAYDAESGRPVWQAGHDRASYCSPVLASLCGHQQIVVVNGHSVTGHDPGNGNILWEHPWPGDYAKVTQPLIIETNRVFIAAGYGIGCALLRIDHSLDGDWSVQPIWKNRNLKPKFTNLVRRAQHVYGLDEGVLTCVNLEQGNREWKEGRYGHGQILLVNELLLIQAESGDVALVEISPEGPRELARFPALQGKTWNNPALVHDLLLVRNDREAACYRLPVNAGLNP